MSIEKKQKYEAGELTINDLIHKQSVRATFKLPKELIELLGVISGQLGIKQKSLLDQLTEDRGELTRLAGGAQKYNLSKGKVKQKTFVLSRYSLNAINSIAKQLSIPRDIIVEVSIRRLLPLIETELEKHHKRKLIRNEMRDYLQAGKRLKNKTRDLLGDNDQLHGMIEEQLLLTEKNIREIDRIIEKGMAMEEW